MKKKKYITREERIRNLINLCLEINSLEERNGSDGKPTVFVSFSGHVSMISIQIYPSGWKKGEPTDLNYSIYTGKSEFSLERYNLIYKALVAVRDGTF